MNATIGCNSCVQASSLRSLCFLSVYPVTVIEKFLRLERKRKRESQTVEQESPCHGENLQILFYILFNVYVTDVKQNYQTAWFHKCLPVVNVPTAPEEPVEEAEAMVPQAEYNNLSQKYDQLNTEYGNLRQDFYKLKEENTRLKEELQKSCFSFSMVKDNATHFLFLTGLTSVIFSWLMTKIKDYVQMQTENLMLEDHLLVVLMKQIGAQ